MASTVSSLLRRDILDLVLPIKQVDEWEDWLRDWIQVGWSPTIPLDAGASHVTWSMPFVRLIEALLPVAIYWFIVLLGLIFIEKDRCLLPQSILFKIKLVYNIFQIFLCSYMTLEGLKIAVGNNYNLFPFFGKDSCNTFDAMNPKLHNLCWVFWMSKIVDFMDTIIIILSGKVSQFTVLHVYHHTTIYSLYWTAILVTYDGDMVLPIVANSLIHAIMYTYYLLAMHVSPLLKQINNISRVKVENPIFWKKYLTQLQLIQFAIMMTHAVTNLYFGCAQDAPRQMMIYLAYIFSLFLLFIRFYAKSYNQKTRQKQKSN